MNFNYVFAATAAAERFTKGHAANLNTYGLIAAVVVLTGISAAIAFTSRHVNCVPEYRIRLQLANVRAARWLVQRAIAAVRAWLNIQADCRALAGSTAKRRRLLAANVCSFGAGVSRFLDTVLCLG